jgi:hypothetical protein
MLANCEYLAIIQQQLRKTDTKRMIMFLRKFEDRAENVGRYIFPKTTYTKKNSKVIISGHCYIIVYHYFHLSANNSDS